MFPCFAVEYDKTQWWWDTCWGFRNSEPYTCWRFWNSELYKNAGHENGPPEIVPSVGGGFQKSTTDSLSTYSTIQGGSLLVQFPKDNKKKLSY